MTDISIIIPTRNRGKSLERTIRSAIDLDYPSDKYEIVIVDNASTDETREIYENVRSVAGRERLKYIMERKIGLHHARHAGAIAAKGALLIYTDDDATFDEGWINAYATEFDRHENMQAAGGPVKAKWEVSPPQWLINYMGGNKIFPVLSIMEPFEEFVLGNEAFFFGVNMAIRRRMLFELGGFNPELFGKVTLGDGESGLLRKLRERGAGIGYIPEATVFHHIPAGRMTLEYLCRWQDHLAGSLMYARYHDHIPDFLGLSSDLVKIARPFFGAFFREFFVRSRTDVHAVNLQTKAALGRAMLRYVFRLQFSSEVRKIVLRKNWLRPEDREGPGV